MKHFDDTVRDEGYRPSEDVHVVWERVWLLNISTWIKLSNLQSFRITLTRNGNGRSVFIGATVVRGREDGYDEGI